MLLLASTIGYQILQKKEENEEEKVLEKKFKETLRKENKICEKIM